MAFKPSFPLTFGMELELQIVDPVSGRLQPGCLSVLDALAPTGRAGQFAKEATLSTLELNSSVHHSVRGMADEVANLLGLARQAAQGLGLDLRGGGAHLAQFWNERVMAPTERANELAGRFGFLPKRFSTYGMHVHVGMPDAESAIRVANVLQAVSPLLIALSAASPFLQLSDTGFASSRALEPLVYPHGGPMPFLSGWQGLEDELAALCATGIAYSLKDIYWDVRPKPEFGTVEVRVFDTPLRLDKALQLAGLTRQLAGLALAGHLRLDAPAPASAQRVSRFMACRDGLDARLFDPLRGDWLPSRDWLRQLLGLVERHLPVAADAEALPTWWALLQDEPEHAWMRRSWADCLAAQAGAGGEATAGALAVHNQAMCEALLSPVPAA